MRYRMNGFVAMLLIGAVGCEYWGGTYVGSANDPPPTDDAFTLTITGTLGAVTVSYVTEQRDAVTGAFECGYHVKECAGLAYDTNLTFVANGCPTSLDSESNIHCPPPPSPVDLTGQATSWNPQNIVAIAVPDPFGVGLGTNTVVLQ